MSQVLITRDAHELFKPSGMLTFPAFHPKEADHHRNPESSPLAEARCDSYRT
jgi:hypothetical protein